MRVKRLGGGTYIDALPDGRFACIQGDKIVTDAGDVLLDSGSFPIGLRCSWGQDFRFGGQGSNFLGVLEWIDGTGWVRDTSVIPTRLGVIYGKDGTRHTWAGGPDRDNDGFRYLAPSGQPVMCDATRLRDGLNEWIDLSDAQDGSLLIGQGNTGGGVQVKAGGVLRWLDTGPCYAINAKREGEQCAVAYSKHGDAAYACWPTVAELHALPVVVFEDEPEEPEEPEEPPVSTPNHLDLVRRLCRDNPTLARSLDEGWGRVVQLVLADLEKGKPGEWGHVGKPRGQGQYTPPGFVPITVNGIDVTGFAPDAIWHKPTNRQVDIFSGGQFNDDGTTVPGFDAERVAQWGEIDRSLYRHDNPWIPPVLASTPSGGDDDDPGDTNDAKDPALAALLNRYIPVPEPNAELAKLRADIEAMMALIHEQDERIHHLESERRQGGRVALKSVHGKYVAIEEDGRLIADRDAIGPFETITLEVLP